MRPAFWPTTHDILTPQMWGRRHPRLRDPRDACGPGRTPRGHLLRYEFVENEPAGTYQEPKCEKHEFRLRCWRFF